MQATRSTPGSRAAFSLQRSMILAMVVAVHGMLALLLLAPASPRHQATGHGRRQRTDGRSLILVFLRPRLRQVQHVRRVAHAPRTTAGRGAAPHRRHIRSLAAVAAHAVHPPPLDLDLPATAVPASPTPSGAVPRYIPGGRDFRQRLRDLHRRRQRRMLPDDSVPGMPHFAMRDPRTQGLAGALHVLARDLLGAADPACVQAGTEITMSKQQRARRHISLQQVRQTIFEHRCVLRPAGWMAPQGPATHLTAGPPGHGVP